ncbi:MAG: Ig-like domain-containing protein [Rhodoblastus sp.]
MTKSHAFAIASAAAGIILIGVESASASCVMRGGRFDPAQNDSVTWSAAVTGGTCPINFRSISSLVFTGTTIVGRPSGGSVSMSGNTSANYQARAGFKGTDSVAFRVCGEGRAGKGCSTITVQLQVQ